jgi:threonine synthase
MRFRSTRGGESVSFEQAVLAGLAPDGGLYMPETINPLPKGVLAALPTLGRTDLCVEVAVGLLGEEHRSLLLGIVDESMTFDAPVVTLAPELHILELFHGPTLAFKDFGARFLAATVSALRGCAADPITVLVATSGDTGGAVANAFHRREGIRVIILYPSGQVSELQELQLTTLGENITALEVKGTFDDCQRLVKEAFADRDLQSKVTLTGANSINLARLVPQLFYYFLGVRTLSPQNGPIVVTVPSGNFGNLTAGILAKRLGLPVSHFIAATNLNDVVPHYLRSGSFQPRPSVRTISNAMDVGDPSNFERLLWLYHGDHQAMTREILGASFDDEATRGEILEVRDRYGYLVDPHTAVGCLAAKAHAPVGSQSLVLHTAHPGKFADILTPLVGDTLRLPEPLLRLRGMKKRSTLLAPDLAALSEVILTHR